MIDEYRVAMESPEDEAILEKIRNTFGIVSKKTDAEKDMLAKLRKYWREKDAK